MRARVCDAAHDAESRLWREVYVADEARLLRERDGGEVNNAWDDDADGGGGGGGVGSLPTNLELL